MAECKICNTTGLALFPVTYALVPDKVKSELPSWANHPGIKALKAPEGFHFALRQLRKGYLFVYYEDLGPESGWSAFRINDHARLSPCSLESAPSLDAFNDAVNCNSPQHIPANMEFITLESPGNATKVWIAYSEHKWIKSVRKQYAENEQLRRERMILVTPKAWMGNPYMTQNGTQALESAIQQTMEYDPSKPKDAFPETLPDTNLTKVVPAKAVKYYEDRVRFVSTEIPWPRKETTASSLLRAMKDRSFHTNFRPVTPMMLALPDIIGLCRELNGFAREASSKLIQFGEELRWQVESHNRLEFIKSHLLNKHLELMSREEGANMPEVSNEIFDKVAEWKRSVAKNSPPPGMTDIEKNHRADVIGQYLYTWADSGINKARYHNYYEPQAKSSIVRSTYQIELLRLDAELQVELATQSQTNRTNAEIAGAKDWAKCYAELNFPYYESFVQAKSKLEEDVSAFFESLIDDLVSYLEEPLFERTLSDYAQDIIDDGVAFHAMVASLINGMEVAKSGAKKIESWINEIDFEGRKNLFWNAMTNLSTDAQTEVKAFLAKISDTAEQLTASIDEASLANIFDQSFNSLKSFADTAEAAAAKVGDHLDASHSTLTFWQRRNLKISQSVVAKAAFLLESTKLNRVTRPVGLLVIRGMLLVGSGAVVDDVVQMNTEAAIRSKRKNRRTRPFTRKNNKLYGMKQKSRLTTGQLLYKHLLKDADNPENTGNASRIIHGNLNSLILLLNAGDLFLKIRSDEKNAWRYGMEVGAATFSVITSMFDVAKVYSEMKLEKPHVRVKGVNNVAYGNLTNNLKLIAGVTLSIASGLEAAIAVDEAIKSSGLKKWAKFFAVAHHSTMALKGLGEGLEALGKKIGKDALRKRGVEIVGNKLIRGLSSGYIMLLLWGIDFLIFLFEKDEVQQFVLKSLFGKESYQIAVSEQKKLPNFDKLPAVYGYGSGQVTREEIQSDRQNTIKASFQNNEQEAEGLMLAIYGEAEPTEVASQDSLIEDEDYLHYEELDEIESLMMS